MKILCGPQNFGYGLEEDKKKYIEFKTPSWDEIIQDRLIISKTEDTTVLDIRCLYNMLIKSYFNSIQLIYSTEKYNCHKLNWFFENRNELSKINLYSCYYYNTRYVIRNLRKNLDSLTLTEGYTFLSLLDRILRVDDFDIMCNESLEFRQHASRMNVDELRKESDKIISQLKNMESSFIKYRGDLNRNLVNGIKEEIKEILKEGVT